VSQKSSDEEEKMEKDENENVKEDDKKERCCDHHILDLVGNLLFLSLCVGIIVILLFLIQL